MLDNSNKLVSKSDKVDRGGGYSHVVSEVQTGGDGRQVGTETVKKQLKKK